MKTPPALLLVVAVAAVARAQTLPPLEEFHVRVFGNGARSLPASDVRDLRQMRDGYLYVAQAKGLSRYNGYRFDPLDLTGARSRFVDHLYTGRDGRLWVFTRENDLGYVERGRFHSLPKPPFTAVNLWETNDGSLWLGGLSGLARVHANDNAPYTDFGTQPEIGHMRVYGVFDIEPGFRVVVTERRLVRVTADSATDRLAFTPFGPECSVAADVRFDAKGLWLPCRGGANGYFVLRYSGGRFTRYNDVGTPRLTLDDFDLTSGVAMFHPERVGWQVDFARPYAAAADRQRWVLLIALQTRDGTRWVVFHDRVDDRDELVRLTGNTMTPVALRDHLDFRQIQRLLEDREGSLWAATDRGLFQLSPRHLYAITRRDGLSEGFTAPVLETRDALWVGTWGGGLHRFGGRGLERRFGVADGLPDAHVRALFEDSNSLLWVGTVRGFAVLRGNTVVRSQRTPSEVRTFVPTSPDSLGRRGLWIGTRLQLLRQDERLVEQHPGFFSNREIWALHVDARGTLWIGTEAGLFILRGDTIHAVTTPESLRGAVVAIHETRDGSLWFCTYERGLYRYRDGKFAAVTSRDGLPADGIWSVLEDGRGGVWMSSDVGLFRVDWTALNAVADSNERGQHEHASARSLRPILYTEAEGLPSREMNRASPSGWRLRDGRLVFNNLQGVVVVDPRAADPVTAPPAVVEAIEADGVRISSLNGLPRVPARTRQLAFQLAALSFVAPEQNRFRYRLDGYDEAWVELDAQRRASYTGLPPREYHLRIQGATATSDWSNEAIYAFEILPAWWQRRSFQLLVFLAAALSLAAAYRYRVSRLLEMQRMRLRIAADLHDDVGSNLSSIALASEMLRGRARLPDPETRQLVRIGQAAEETIVALRDIIWLVDPKHNDLPGLVARMRDVAGQILNGTDHTLTAPDPLFDRPLSMTFVRNTLLIYKEALHNVHKHAEANRVVVLLRERRGQLTMDIEDDGAGFDEATVGRGHGLDSMRRRAAQIGGSIDIATSPGRGTRITFSAKMA